MTGFPYKGRRRSVDDDDLVQGNPPLPLLLLGARCPKYFLLVRVYLHSLSPPPRILVILHPPFIKERLQVGKVLGKGVGGVRLITFPLISSGV